MKHFILASAAASVALAAGAPAAHAGATFDAVRRVAPLSAAFIPPSMASARRMTRGSGEASTWTCAAPSPLPGSGDATKVKYVPLSAQARLTALQSGEIDMLSRNTTPPGR